MRFWRPLPITLAGLSLALLVGSNSPASADHPGNGEDDFQIRRIISANAVLSGPSPDLKEIGVQVRNLGDHDETVRVYMDVIPPGGLSDPGGCLPNGRILDTTVSLSFVGTPIDPSAFEKQANVFADTGTMGDGMVEFSCTNQSKVQGLRYMLIAAVDAHDDDSGDCEEGELLTSVCANALVSDDPDSNNRLSRYAPRVQ